jgi:hypothetical protein
MKVKGGGCLRDPYRDSAVPTVGTGANLAHQVRPQLFYRIQRPSAAGFLFPGL